MEVALPAILTSVVERLFTGGPGDAVIAILLLVVGVLAYALRTANKAVDTAHTRLDELQRYSMERMNQNNKELADLLLTLSDRHADSQEKVTSALASVNESVRAVVFDLKQRLTQGQP